jgi:hypothetical protein
MAKENMAKKMAKARAGLAISYWRGRRSGVLGWKTGLGAIRLRKRSQLIPFRLLLGGCLPLVRKHHEGKSVRFRRGRAAVMDVVFLDRVPLSRFAGMGR